MGVAPPDPIERRLGEIDEAVFDQRLHEAEQEGEQQRPDVHAVDIGVGHQDDL